MSEEANSAETHNRMPTKTKGPHQLTTTEHQRSDKGYTRCTTTGTAEKEFRVQVEHFYQEAFNRIKKLVCKDMTLHYFDVRKPVTIQVDASFIIESDHRSLEQINMKNLADTPACLQRMLLRLQNCDLAIKYKKMLLADTLSCYAPQNGPEVTLDIAIHHVHITPEKKLEFQRSIQDDPLLHTLAETIVAGWPEKVSDVPNVLRPYHQYQYMTVEDGLILKGESLITPPPQQKGRRYYTGYIRDTKASPSASITQHCVYWPGINQDIKCMVESCATCQ